MASYFEDLQPCTAFPGEWRNLLAVGWLSKRHEYARGPVAHELAERLRRASSWEPENAPRELHTCELCSEADRPRSARGALFVVGRGVLYVAPRLIHHYVRKHGYQPPSAFLEALTDQTVSREAVTAHLLDFVEPTPTDARSYVDSLELIRMRPGMYVGPLDSRGLGLLLSIVTDVFINEHLSGASTRLSIDLNETGQVTVEDDGAGISLEPDPRLGPLVPRPWVEALFGMFIHPQPPTQTARSPYPVTHGPWSYPSGVVTALSSRLEVESRRDGSAWRLTFASGSPVRGLTNAGSTSQRGTVVRYQPDDEIFDANARHDLAAIETHLRGVALLCPRLDVRFQGRSLQCPDGLATWLHQVAPELVKETILSARGTVNGIDVEAVFAWRPRATALLMRSFVNYAETPGGGPHVRGLTLAVENVVNAKRASRTKKAVAGIVGAVHVGMQHPQLETSGALREDRNVRNAVRDVVTRAINAAPWWWDRLHTAIG